MSDAGILSAVIVAVIAAFYLMFLRPIAKDQERHRREMRNLRPGDEVVTTSNFIGRIRDIEILETGETRITLALSDGVVVTALPGAILRRLSPAPEEQREKPSPGVEGST